MAWCNSSLNFFGPGPGQSRRRKGSVVISKLSAYFSHRPRPGARPARRPCRPGEHADRLRRPRRMQLVRGPSRPGDDEARFWSIVVGMMLVMGIPAIFAALVIKSEFFDKNRYEFDPNKTWSVLEQGRGSRTIKAADRREAGDGAARRGPGRPGRRCQEARRGDADAPGRLRVVAFGWRKRSHTSSSGWRGSAVARSASTARSN